jgi:uncharacterized protein YndB with AHSA1/START domain
MTEGTLVEIDGRPALVFERRLAHPIERVWRAVSTHDELAAWFVVPMEFTKAGQRFEAMDQPGEVLRYEPPRALEWEWGGERFSFDLEPAEDETRLTFVHVIGDRERGADYASGWHFHLDRLEAHLAARPVPDADPAELLALNDRYAERFGLDREVGRRQIAEHFGAQETGESAG